MSINPPLNNEAWLSTIIKQCLTAQRFYQAKMQILVGDADDNPAAGATGTNCAISRQQAFAHADGLSYRPGEKILIYA
jgi:hypothetical protein